MAQKQFSCKLITPEAKVFDLPATAAVVPAWDGSIGILPDRAPLVAKLGIGELRIDFADHDGGEGGSHAYFVEDGFVRMARNTLTILATRAIPAEKLTESDAQAELAEAEARRTDGLSAAEVERVRRERDRAATKLRIARQFKAKGSGI